MPKYTVKGTNILHNGKVYAEGTTIELSENQAKSLADFLESVPETKKETPKQEENTPDKPAKETKTQAKTSKEPENKEEGGN
ncbi:MAG: hypothetical protein UR30_C0005G0085 [Candidatus Peregrinibacteria bacterium GW2011_GWC2_33_13]|nr:MAG: hypothetical protein UR30_C0005G0085 [Candidatus Peregrinibacteria bacterium GW2011_GWC2_33_13]